MAFGQLQNFLASFRKPGLKLFGLFSPNDNLEFIQTIPVSAPITPVALTGTVDGTNAVFTIPGTVAGGAGIYKNGVLQDPLVHYSLSGTTVTFVDPYVPNVGDDLQVIFT